MSKIRAEDDEPLLEITGYSEKVRNLYREQVNVGTLANPDVAYTYTGPCGDTIKLYLQISDNEVIEQARFQYIGCPASAASGSILTQLITTKTIQEAESITPADILLQLDSLPEEDCHCAELVVTTLHKTLASYQRND
jgi:nitrogen fixation NifU-like protein